MYVPPDFFYFPSSIAEWMALKQSLSFRLLPLKFGLPEECKVHELRK